MIGLKNQFFEKKIINIIENKNINYALLFHYNSISSKEWVTLKKQVFQINPNIINKVVPNRFLSKLWKSLNIKPFNTIPHKDLLLEHPLYSTTNEEPGLFTNTNECNEVDTLGAASCLFFCSNIGDLGKILNIIEVSDLHSKLDEREQISTGNQLIQNLVKSFSPEGLKGLHISQKFMNVGLLSFNDNSTTSWQTSAQNLVQIKPSIKSKLLEHDREVGLCNRNAIYLNFFDTKKLIELSKKSNLITNHPNQNIVFQLYSKNQELVNSLRFNSHSNQLINMIKFTQYFLYGSIAALTNTNVR